MIGIVKCRGGLISPVGPRSMEGSGDVESRALSIRIG